MNVLLATTSALIPVTTYLDLTNARVLLDSHSKIHTHARMWTSVQAGSINVTYPRRPPARTQMAPIHVCVKMGIKRIIQDSCVLVGGIIVCIN